MKLIVIEGTIYKVSEKLYKEIRKKEEQILKQEYYRGQEMDFRDFVDEIKPRLKYIGVVSFSFCL